MASLSILLWVFVVLFFILAVVFIFLYFSSRSYLIDPSQCPTNGANYGVVVGRTGTLLDLCPGQGIDPTTAQCLFQINSLASAINNCNSSPQTCQAFTFDGFEQAFVSYPLTVGQPTDTTYIRQI